MICPLAVPPPWSPSAMTATDSLAIGPRAVVIVARMAAGERYKGHDALLAAWPMVLARQPDAQLVIVGRGDDEARLRARAQEGGVGARVLFTGFVDEASLAAIYARAALFAMPSRGEGFGIAYLEAMARGLPCIGSVHDAAGEVIDDGVTGYLIDQSDTQALADRVSGLLGDDARRREMGEAGRRRLSERFTADRFARRLGDLVDAALDAETPSGAWRTSRTH
jgi:phosphatidylinositol alpha-1,6-mannosyltransferase